MAQGGKGPPHGTGGPIPIPAPLDVEIRNGEMIKKSMNDIFKILHIILFYEIVYCIQSYNYYRSKNYFLTNFLLMLPPSD